MLALDHAVDGSRIDVLGERVDGIPTAYEDPLVITKNVTIVGQCLEMVEVQGLPGEPVVTIEASNAQLVGLSIAGGSTGVLVEGAEPSQPVTISLVDLDVHDVAGPGVVFADGGGEVTSSRIRSVMGAGIRVSVSTGAPSNEAPVGVEVTVVGSAVQDVRTGEFDGTPAPRWTIGVSDRPEIDTRITDEGGCADIALPARSHLEITATKPGWIPNAAPVSVGDVDLPPMEARVLHGFSGLPPWWWSVTSPSDCSGVLDKPDAGASGVAAFAIWERAAYRKDGSHVSIPDVVPILRTSNGQSSDRWLYADSLNQNFRNMSLPCTQCWSRGVGVMARIPPGRAQIELPGLDCGAEAAEGTYGWPVAGTSNAFEIEVRAGVVVALLALCDRV